MITVSMPLYIEMGFKCKNRKPILDKDGNKIPRKYHLNLNNYRNWHYQTSNKLKAKYKEIAAKKLEILEMDKLGTPPYILHFILWRADKRKGDRSNPLSVHEKFFCDSMVELGYITDDNDLYIDSSRYSTGGVNKENPRVDILIEEIRHE
jgi:hypothetical protein